MTTEQNKMGTEPIAKLILSMSLPMMLSMLVTALYNIVDSIFVSRIGENALTAVSLSFPIQNLMIAISVGTGVGINAILSMNLGKKDYKAVSRVAKNGIFLNICGSLVFLIFGLFFSPFYFRSQTDIPEIIDYGVQYLNICCVFSFGLFLEVTFEKLLQATGKTLFSMYTQGLGAVINIILDPILIFGYFGLPAMGVAGAAIATVVGQIASMFLGAFLNIKKNREIDFHFEDLKLHGQTIKEIYSIGVPSIFMASITSVMTFGMNKILAAFSSTAIAFFGIYFKLQSFVFMPVFGLNNGIISIISYNYGAKNKDRIIHTIRDANIYAFLIMGIGFLIFQIFPKTLLQFFNASQTMYDIGIPALRLISISYIFAAFSVICTSLFQSMGHAVLSLMVSLIRQLCVLLPVAWLLSFIGVLNYIWLSFPIAEIIAVLLCVVFLRKVYREKIAILPGKVL